MLQKLEKEIDDVDAKIGDRWKILDRYLSRWSFLERRYVFHIIVFTTSTHSFSSKYNSFDEKCLLVTYHWSILSQLTGITTFAYSHSQGSLVHLTKAVRLLLKKIERKGNLFGLRLGKVSLLKQNPSIRKIWQKKITGKVRMTWT